MTVQRKFALAVDPGKRSGWALFDTETDRISGGELDFLETAALIHTTGAEYGPELAIISEAFLITNQTVKNTQATWSLELIGVARYVAQAYTMQDLILQAPSSAKRFSSDARLKALGWHVPGQGHANDAKRHLLLYLVERGWWRDSLVT